MLQVPVMKKVLNKNSKELIGKDHLDKNRYYKVNFKKLGLQIKFKMRRKLIKIKVQYLDYI